MAAAVSAVVFDYGGVLVPAPYDAVTAHEAELGLPPGALRDRFREGDAALDRFLVGEISYRDFLKKVGEAVASDHGLRISLRALAEVAGPQPATPEMLDVVRDVHRQTRLAVLTNNGGSELWRAHVPIDLFEVVVDSAEVGVRKPDPAIYEILLGRLGCPPESVLYFDDLEENLPPARALGIRAVRFDGAAACRAVLEDAGVLSPRQEAARHRFEAAE